MWLASKASSVLRRASLDERYGGGSPGARLLLWRTSSDRSHRWPEGCLLAALSHFAAARIHPRVLTAVCSFAVRWSIPPFTRGQKLIPEEGSVFSVARQSGGWRLSPQLNTSPPALLGIGCCPQCLHSQESSLLAELSLACSGDSSSVPASPPRMGRTPESAALGGLPSQQLPGPRAKMAEEGKRVPSLSAAVLPPTPSHFPFPNKMWAEGGGQERWLSSTQPRAQALMLSPATAFSFLHCHFCHQWRHSRRR